MNFLRLNWFNIGLIFALATGIYIFLVPLDWISLILWFNLIALFIHQFEEYHFPGYFPGMMNKVMFSSEEPDRYPLNTNTAMIINVFIGWITYFLAALLAEKGIWLGIAAILVSAGNFIAHTFLFNIKGKSFYNPGMISSNLLFLPVTVAFFVLIIRGNIATPIDWIAGIVLGIILNYVGILKLIDWLKNRSTLFIFPTRFLPPKSR